jgi:hypothetical protein
MTEWYLASQAVLCDQGCWGPRAAWLPKPILSGSSYPENCSQAYRYTNYPCCFFHSLPGLLPGEHLVTRRAYKQLPSILRKQCGTKPLFSFWAVALKYYVKRYVFLFPTTPRPKVCTSGMAQTKSPILGRLIWARWELLFRARPFGRPIRGARRPCFLFVTFFYFLFFVLYKIVRGLKTVLHFK